jgi:AcrR family transcriptional regulator
VSTSNATRKRGRPRDEPSLVAALVRGTLAVAADPRATLTIDSVVAAAGTSKPRVYRYFPSAEAAFSRVLAEIVDAQGRAQCGALMAGGTADERFGRLRRLLAAPDDEQRTLFRLELLALQQAASDPTLIHQVQATDAEAVAALRELFSDAERERGLLAGYPPDQAARTLWLLRRGCLTTMLSPGQGSPGADPLEPLQHFWHVVTHPPRAPGRPPPSA